jgi:uncharacterized protein YdhG (YjbR/CyaY superfamily)
MTQAKAKNVDSYIAAPEAARPILRLLSRIFTAAVPEAEETISYGMPFYRYHGRLAYFAAHKDHVGLYALGPVSQYPSELKALTAGLATLRFRLGQPLPTALIRDLVTARQPQSRDWPSANGRAARRSRQGAQLQVRLERPVR